MKNYRHLLTSLTVMMFIIVSGFLASCEGPEGPAGPAGAAGTAGANGMDASSKCIACHSDAAKEVNLAFAQFGFSLHGEGETYKYTAGRISCGSCHNGDAFAEAVALNSNDAVTVATSKINCKTCHVIHSKYDETDWALRFNKSFDLLYSGSTTPATVDFKTGNTCAKCHQARSFTRVQVNGMDSISAASGSATYSRFGPHYGTPTNVIAMKGLVEIPGEVAYPTSNPHSPFQSNCVTCHMGSNPTNPAAGGHTFKMTVAQMSTIESCKGCHSAGIPDAKTKEIKVLIAEYRQLLLDKGMLDTSQAEGDTYNVLGEYAKVSAPGVKTVYPSADVDALLNYLYIAKDRSFGAHNPGYILAVAKNGIAQLKK